MTKTMIKKSLRAYISAGQFVFLVLLHGKAIRLALFQALEHIIHRVHIGLGFPPSGLVLISFKNSPPVFYDLEPTASSISEFVQQFVAQMKSRGPKEAPWEMADSWMLHPPQRLIRLGSHELVQAGVAGKTVE